MDKNKKVLRYLFPLIILLCILIPTVSTGAFFLYEINDTYNVQQQDEASIRIKSMDIALDQFLDTHSSTLEFLSSSTVWNEFDNVNSDFTQVEMKSFYSDLSTFPNQEYASKFQILKDSITTFENIEIIDTIYIGTPDKNMFGNDDGDSSTLIFGEDSEFDCTTREWYIGAVSMNGNVYWSTPYIDRRSPTDSPSIISASKAVYNAENELIAVISLDVLINDFIEEVLELRLSNSFASYILDNQGRIIIGDEEEIGEVISNTKILQFIRQSDNSFNDASTVYSKMINDKSGWIIVESYNSLNLRNVFLDTLSSSWWYIIITIVFVVGATYFISRFFLHPIETLTEYFNNLEKDKNILHELAPPKYHKKNEIGVLFTSIIKMQQSAAETMKKYEYVSFHDPLTNTYKERFFEEEKSRLDNRKNLPLSILMIDVNGLKLINDEFGNYSGDKVLNITGDLLAKYTKDNDIVSRLGGDEFAVILTNTSSENCKNLIKSIKSDFIDSSTEYGEISLAIGSKTKELMNEDIEDIFLLAEELMKEDKK